MTYPTVLEPIRRYSKALHSPPYKYSDDLYLTLLDHFDGVPFKVYFGRLRARTTVGPLLGAFRIPGLRNQAIISAYAHPFTIEALETDRGDETGGHYGPAADDGDIIRPELAIREKHVLELLLTRQDSNTGPGEVPGDAIAMPIESINRRHSSADFFASPTPALPDSIEGAADTDQQKGTRILHVEDQGVNATDAGLNDYQLQLNSGARIVVQAAPASAPQEGDPWPSTQEADRVNVNVNETLLGWNRMYPKRNVYPVPDLSALGDHNQPDNEQHNPNIIAAVQEIDDPDNPGTTIKRVTLVSGSTVTVSEDTTTVPGEALEGYGETGIDESDFAQETLDIGEWVEFDIILVTKQVQPHEGSAVVSTDLTVRVEDDEQSLAGWAPDVWPFRGF